MAMEVRYSKRLHRHMLPVVVLLGALIIISAIAFSNNRISVETASKALVSRTVRVTPTPNGLSKITATKAHSEDLSGVSIDQAGREAALSLNFQE